jgi:hypothetical protein
VKKLIGNGPSMPDDFWGTAVATREKLFQNSTTRDHHASSILRYDQTRVHFLDKIAEQSVASIAFGESRNDYDK